MKKIPFWQQRIQQTENKVKKRANKFLYVRYQFKSTPVLFLKIDDQIAVSQNVFHGVRYYATAIIKELLQMHYENDKCGFIIDYFGDNRVIYLDCYKEMLVLKEN